MVQLPVDPARFATFLGVMAVMAVTPGPANVFAIATGAEKGKAAALTAVAGMNLATLVWFAAAALGLGGIILAFPRAFHLVALAGAAYVAWLGVKSLLAARQAGGELAPSRFKPGRSALRDGFAVQISNPKAVLFFTAVLPPFLDPHRPLPSQLLAFACATIGFDLISMSSYGLGGAALAARMTEPGFRRVFQVGVGLLLLAAAALMALRH
ncbi:LysE family translocator [Phenylobacterium aquaticum]|uniref:LysE family translocator n=1 Tax=Phenylobacterium aquaticum TaxID=1763816 RepID=UPI001F5C2855|nr:LysE family translocator [Phenylobacterium aquaticum]MCI3135649.1 LysE family translocator [Phenylobacterium aquaticum]